ncbi:MAG: homocysteine S-methyltransferase family protein, partial [Bacteroidaceae bacterium]|nr:homocysteine S-methyltransferase family protein [Bacteroidaceae bacterium]
MQNLQTLVQNRVLILDGAMGTMIQRYKLTEADYRGTRFADLPGIQCGNNDLLTLSAPHIIEDIHRKYLDAGADIIETNTFNAQRVSMADYGCQALCREMNLAAAKLARKLANEYTQQNPSKPRFVAGSIGPTNRTLSMSPDANNPALRNLTFDELVDAYQEQIEALLEGGVDALLIETIFDTLNAKAALVATEEAFKRFAAVPVMLSLTLADKAGRSFSGQTLDAFWASVQHYPIFSVGLNCSFGADQMKPFLKHLSQIVPCYISAYPNAGLPNALGEYDQTPQDMARLVRELIEEGVVNIIGGCCGTTNEYIAAITQEISPLPQFTSPRQTKPADERLTLSGLEATSLSGDNAFLAIGERCNVAGSRKFLRLIKEKDYTSAIEIARQQVLDGAMCIDINLDDA